MRVLAIVSVLGRDQKGVVARISTYLAERDVNIEDIEQRVVRGQFLMDMLVDITGASVSLDELITGLLGIGDEIGMEIRVSLHGARDRKRVAVLVSKEAHCLEQLIADQRAGDLNGDIVAVIGNHESLREHAEAAGLPFSWHPSTDKEAHEAFLLRELQACQPDVVVLARYMQILSPEFCQFLRGRAINIHHSFLPSFKGAKPYYQAHDRGVKLIGATAHYVTADLDEGPIIEQDVARVDHSLSPEDFTAVGRDVECVVLARAVKWHVEHRVLMNGHKTVVFK